MSKFYIDALEAAYMAREFGVKFVGQELAHGEYMEGGYDVLRHYMPAEIHPDSLPIFEPQHGDLVYDIITSIFCLADILMLKRPATLIIIRRTGKPFFMPTREETPS